MAHGTNAPANGPRRQQHGCTTAFSPLLFSFSAGAADWCAGGNFGSTSARMDLLWPILEKWVWEILCAHSNLSSPQITKGCVFLIIFSVFLTFLSCSHHTCPVGPNQRFTTMFIRRHWCRFVTENPGCPAACGKLDLVYVCLDTNDLFALLQQSLYSFVLYPLSHSVYT